MNELNSDELHLLDQVVGARLFEVHPGCHWGRAIADLKADGRMQLAVDETWVHVALDNRAFVSVDRERLTLALLTDDPLGEIRAGEVG